MFFIINSTKNKISIGDLGLILGPRKALDLDKRMKRSKSESSKTLKNLIHAGIIKVKRKDFDTPPAKEVTEIHTTDSEELKKLRKEMQKSMKEMAQDIKDEMSKSDKNVSVKDLNEMMEQIKKSIENINVTQGTSIQQENLEEEVEIDIEKISEIHKRAVEKIVKNTKSENIQHREHIEVNDLEQNVSELEDLLSSD